jgi:hypothetical protein
LRHHFEVLADGAGRIWQPAARRRASSLNPECAVAPQRQACAAGAHHPQGRVRG